jgi:antitoxin (DNA-binding transcriptional repressor) of toxin-antitoxin stability system
MMRRSRAGQTIEIVIHGGAVAKLTVSEVIACRSSGCD